MNTFNLELDVPQEDGDIVTELEGKNKITEEDEELLALEKLADEVSEDDVNEDPESYEGATNSHPTIELDVSNQVGHPFNVFSIHGFGKEMCFKSWVAYYKTQSVGA